jgi:hypothetical protein
MQTIHHIGLDGGDNFELALNLNIQSSLGERFLGLYFSKTGNQDLPWHVLKIGVS